jgi:predicted amidohydrolase
MRVGLCQYETASGDFKVNLAKVVKGLELAERDRVEILCFPECFLTGYQDREDAARKHAFASDSPQVLELLDKTSRFDATLVVGFNELRGEKLFNTAIVAHKGHILGSYSKCMTLMPFHTPGRDFPVFNRGGVKFGVVICADGGYIEPARILALKGARVIFAPHYNYIPKRGLIQHYEHVRHDHVARAVENMVYFVRASNVGIGKEEGITAYDGQAYGDSYIVDPFGEIVARSRRHKEDYVFAEIDTTISDPTFKVGRSKYSLQQLSKQLLEAVENHSQNS